MMIKDKLIKSILEYLNNPNDIEVACEDESYSKRLMNFILSDSQKKIEKLYNNEYLNNPSNVEVICEDEDYVYKMRISMVSKKKIYCKDCSYSKNRKCLYNEEYQEKKYCPYFTTENRCWDCVNYKGYGGDDCYCELDLEHEFGYNSKNKCPEWEFEGI